MRNSILLIYHRLDLFRHQPSDLGLQHHYLQPILASLSLQHTLRDQVQVRHGWSVVSDSDQSAFHWTVRHGTLPCRTVFPCPRCGSRGQCRWHTVQGSGYYHDHMSSFHCYLPVSSQQGFCPIIQGKSLEPATSRGLKTMFKSHSAKRHDPTYSLRELILLTSVCR